MPWEALGRDKFSEMAKCFFKSGLEASISAPLVIPNSWGRKRWDFFLFSSTTVWFYLNSTSHFEIKNYDLEMKELKRLSQDKQDGSVCKTACCQAWLPELDPQDPHGRSGSPTPTQLPFLHICTYTHVERGEGREREFKCQIPKKIKNKKRKKKRKKKWGFKDQ